MPLNGTPTGAGGVPPFEQDMNGIMLQTTQTSQWTQAGGVFPYDAAFSAAIGGYPNGAFIKAAAVGKYWMSVVDNNVTNPDAGGAGWILFDPTGSMTTGDVKWRATAENLPGWIPANGLTIGNASSGATGLASASAADLFAWHWNNFPNTQCPVSTGRGANAAADFAANKTITILDLKGTATMGMDTMGGAATTRLTGVPTIFGNATTPGSTIGENLHSLVANENGQHAHGVTDPTHDHAVTGGTIGGTTSATGAGPTSAFPAGPTAIDIVPALTGVSIQNSGSGQAHNTVHRVMVGTIYLKL